MLKLVGKETSHGAISSEGKGLLISLRSRNARTQSNLRTYITPFWVGETIYFSGDACFLLTNYIISNMTELGPQSTGVILRQQRASCQGH